MKCSMNQIPTMTNQKFDADYILHSVSTSEKNNNAKINKIVTRMVNSIEDYLHRVEQQNEEKIDRLINQKATEDSFDVMMQLDGYQELEVNKK